MKLLRKLFLALTLAVIVGLGVLVLMGLSTAGCNNQGTASRATPGSSQEERGLGIVQGTLGAQRAGATPRPGAAIVKGQVLTIEGGAYVVKEFGGQGCTILIRNIDQEVELDR